MLSTSAQSLAVPDHEVERRDAFAYDDDHHFYALAEGLAEGPRGLAAATRCLELLQGEVARVAAGHVQSRPELDRALRVEVDDALETAVQRVNGRLLAEAAGLTWRRAMAASALFVQILGGQAFVHHAGRCRLYRLREGTAELLTADHTLDRHTFGRGLMSRPGLLSTAGTEVCMAFGLVPALRTDSLVLDIDPGDLFVLTSGRVSHHIGGAELARLYASGGRRGFEAALGERLAWAYRNSPDPMSVLVLRTAGQAGALGRSDRRVTALMQRIFLFRQLSETERQRVRKILYARQAAPGEVIIRTGEAGTEFFIVVSGRVRVQRGGRTLTDIGPGGHFGELALVEEAPRSATVIALEQTDLLTIHRDDFLALTRANDDLARKLLSALLLALSDRLRDLSRRAASG